MDTPEYDLRVSDFDMPALNNLRAFMATRPDTYIPRNYVEAMERPDLWEQPIKDEMAIMRKRGVFTLVDRCFAKSVCSGGAYQWNPSPRLSLLPLQYRRFRWRVGL